MASEGSATESRSTFRRSVAVSCEIRATPGLVWSLLTDAEAFPRWNSTVTRIEGPISLGHRLRIHVPISKRAFTPTVTAFESEKRMVWSDGQAPFFQGSREFILSPGDRGTTRFTMTETFTGLMLPLIGRSLPEFVPVFNAYAADLAREAELRARRS